MPGTAKAWHDKKNYTLDYLAERGFTFHFPLLVFSFFICSNGK